MTARTCIRALGLLTGALVVAACGGTGPTNVPTVSQAPAVTLAATQAPAATGQEIPSFALPSFHGNVDLEKLIPTSIGGEAITTLSMTGDEFVGSGSDTELTAVLAALNKQPSDLSVAFGGNSMVQIIAFQVNGVPGGQILDAFYNASKSTLDATISDVTIAGKAVKKITPSSATDTPTYVYAKDDVVYTVGASGETELTDALLTETFQKLP